MALDTKLNLNNYNVEQLSGDTLNLSGNTTFHSIVNSVNGYQVTNSGTTIAKDNNNNLVLADVITGSKTLGELATGATRIVSTSKNSYVSFENNGADEFVTIKGIDNNYIQKLINNSGDTISVLTRDGNQGYNTISPQEKIHINSGNILLSGNTTGSSYNNITVKNNNLSGSTSIILSASTGTLGESINLILAEPGDTKSSYPTGYSDVGQIYENVINPTYNSYPYQILSFNIFLLSASGTTRCEVFDGSGYTGTLLETKDILISTNDGGNRTFTFDTPVPITADQIVTLKITKVTGAGTFGVGISTGSYTYPLIFDGTLGSDIGDFYVYGSTYSGNTAGAEEAKLLIKRVGEYDENEITKYRGNTRFTTDTKIYLGGGNGIIFQTSGLTSESSPMTDVFEIDTQGLLKTLNTGYTSLVTNDEDILNKGYVSLNYANLSGSSFSGNISALNLSGTNTGDQDSTNITLARVSGSTYSTLQEVQNLFHSAGWGSGGEIIDDGDGTITVSAGTGFIRATNNVYGEILFTDWATESGANVNLTTGATNYIYVEYNSGSPRVIATTSVRTDNNTNILLAHVYRNGIILHIDETVKDKVVDHAKQMLLRNKEVMPYANVSGSRISETGTRNIAVTPGAFWQGLLKFFTNEFNSLSGDTFSAFYRNGVGGHIEITGQTQINNTQYDDNSGTLATLSNNRYGVHWVYQESDSHVNVVFGQGNYTLSEAQDALVPSDIPDEIIATGYIIGRIIILKSDTTFTDILSVFNKQFSVAPVASHSSLVNLTWANSGHIGTNSTIAAFNTGGTATYMGAASASTSGYLTSSDWNKFNDKLNSISGSSTEILTSNGAGGINADANFTWDGTQFKINDGGSNITKIQGDGILVANDNISINGSSGFTPQLGNYSMMNIRSYYDLNNFVNVELLGSSGSNKNRMTFRIQDSGSSFYVYYNKTGISFSDDLSAGYTDRHVPDVAYVHNPALKSGVDQATAGAAAGELWVDTSAGNVVKMGV